VGLSSLTLNADLATAWRGILEQKGLTVCYDEVEANKPASKSQRVSEAPWLIRDGDVELRVLEASYRDQPLVHFIFMSFDSREQRLLFSIVQKQLIAAGATVGSKPPPL
jgi:hypothetical protein